MRPDTQQWWDQAQADLWDAVTVLAAGEYFATSLFAQQAAEKALKALYVEQRGGTSPPKSHDLEFLGTEVGAPPSLEPEFDTLADTITLARYPDIGSPAPVNGIRRPDAESHLEAARRIVAWTTSQL